MTAAPKRRKPTKLTLDNDRNAILPKIGHVPNMTCTAISAKCGMIGRSVDEGFELILTAFFGGFSD
jgi:hypothetical protein